LEKPVSGLNPKQQQFVREYLVDQNATQAAIRAGYSAKTAYSIGQRLLKHVEVAAAIEAGRQVLAIRTEVTAERTLEQMARLGWGDLRKAFSPEGRLLLPHEWSDDTAAFISSIEVVTRGAGEGEVEYVSKIRAADKRAALADIARTLGMFKDRMEVKHIGAVFITAQWQAVQGAIMAALEPYPDARIAVLNALEAVL